MITMIVNGHNAVRRVCAHCVAKLQRGDGYAAQMAILSTMQPPEQELACPVCGRTSGDLIRTGRVGCGFCYQAMDEMILPLFVRMNGRAALPDKDAEAAELPQQEEKSRVEKLREDLYAAVNAEEYERAAQLRDEIRALEGEAGKRI